MSTYLFASAYGEQNASTRTRMTAWVDRLRDTVQFDKADELTVLAPFSGGRLEAARAMRRRHDAVFIQRNVARASTGHIEALLLRRAGLAVYDIDDGLPWDTGGSGRFGRVKRVLTRAAIARRAAAAADRVIAGNDVLADWASALCGDVVVIPTCVEPTDYRQKTAYELHDPPVIGWIGSPATTPHLAIAARALAEVHRRTGARLHLLGANERDPAIQRLRRFTTVTPWSLQAQHDVLADWDIGIMPLPDGPYERAKCGYKLLQYGAVGLPAAASPVGVNARIAVEGCLGAPSTGEDWTDVVLGLLSSSAEHRSEDGRRFAHCVDVSYSYRRWQQQWVAAALATGSA